MFLGGRPTQLFNLITSALELVDWKTLVWLGRTIRIVGTYIEYEIKYFQQDRNLNANTSGATPSTSMIQKSYSR